MREPPRGTPGSTCADCGGILAPSQYGGFVHDDDADDTHTPRVIPPERVR